MASAIHPKISPDEYEGIMVDGGWTAPIEYLDGEAVVIPPSGGQAGAAQYRLAGELHAWQKASGDRGLVLADVFMLVSDNTLAPDLAYWSTAPEVPRGRMGAPVPDLVIEVLSPATDAKDRGPKLRVYLASGVREVWLVDPAERTVAVCRPGAEAVVLPAGEELRSEILCGFAVRVDELFAC